MRNKITFLGLICAGALLLTGCGNDKSVTDELIIAKDSEGIAISEPFGKAVKDLNGLPLGCLVFYDDDNNTSAEVNGTVSWSSSDTSIATVSAGLVKMASSKGGDVNITASYGPFSKYITLNVYALSDINVSIDINGTFIEDNVTLPVTSSSYPMMAMGTFTNTVTDTNESAVDITNDVTWISSDTTVATIDTAGQLKTLSVNGTLEVFAFAFDINGTIDLNVSLP